MRQTNRHMKTLGYYGAVVSAAVFFFTFQSKSKPANTGPAAVPSATVDSQNVQKINPGSAESAIAYYGKTLTQLGLNPDNLPPAVLVNRTNLSQVMVYLGYPDLSLKDIEDLPSAELMNRYPGDILSSAFFAPKITDVSVQTIIPGWRKLVRFKAKGKALENGVSAGFLLFNKFQRDLDKDPFGDQSNESENTQLILTKGENSALEYPVYFLVFGERSGTSKLITFLTATFDARAPDIVTDNRYYVPNACAACHGGLNDETEEPEYANLKLNFLDTDHWFDRIRKGNDFAFLKDHTCGKNFRCPVLYDGGNDPAQIERAFTVIRELNREIKKQNESVPPPRSFQLRAVNKWIELHETDSKPKNVFLRALPPEPAGSGEPWRADNSTDKALLPLLDRYCYRCHSSLKFNVFDKPEVVKRRDKISRFMKLAIDDPLKMPQDRNLDCSSFKDKKEILRLVESFPKPTPTP